MSRFLDGVRPLPTDPTVPNSREHGGWCETTHDSVFGERHVGFSATWHEAVHCNTDSNAKLRFSARKSGCFSRDQQAIPRKIQLSWVFHVFYLKSVPIPPLLCEFCMHFEDEVCIKCHFVGVARHRKLVPVGEAGLGLTPTTCS